MLSKAQMVKAKKALETLYDGICTITEHHKIKNENKSTGFVDVVVLENQPCRLSYKTIDATSAGESVASVSQTIKVFLPPDIEVKPGSKLTITQNGVTVDYKCSGQPAIYSAHQEVILELFEGWA